MAIRLSSGQNYTTTMVSNIFIDTYMPAANGEFVKIYLYLLRCISGGREDLSICTLADTFNNTENDICRALKYWEQQKLLTLKKNEAGIVTEIQLNDISVPAAAAAASDQAAPSNQTLESTGTANTVSTQTTDAGTVVFDKLPPKTMDTERVASLSQQEDIQQLFCIVEQYLGRTLGSTHINTILYLYDKLHFSADLIEYLVEYCVSRGNKSIRYIETVGLAWHAEHITTVEQAREASSQYNKYIFTVLKSFVIKGRSPVASEVSYIKKWTSDYGFTLDIITQACERTVTQIHQPSFEYADKILDNWHKQGVKHAADISPLDERHQRTKKPVPRTGDSSNKFNNFEQRTYDFNDLERQLLNIK